MCVYLGKVRSAMLFFKKRVCIDIAYNEICWRHTDVWSHPGHYPVHSPTRWWSNKGQCHGHAWATHIHFIPCQSALPFLRCGYFKLWHHNLKNPRSRSWVRSKIRSYRLTSTNQCTSFSFHVNRTSHSWDMSNTFFDFEKTHPFF